MEHMQTTETTHKLAKLAKCAHEGCACNVSLGEEFCSDYCAAQAGSDESDYEEADALHAAGGPGGCGCGHPECAPAGGTSPARGALPNA